ncbi:hypothetical protein PBCVCvsA1_241L [Paramecium bursaria Chlorella virus CvsA1]|nr:hypothetical protein PBCVCvsA1_241L [Paramecium bursaria Chlorella virus CvsA1]AGE55240.1 hypothetical protein PBCVMA1E_275L [Paramecium bursaria Chlorella virus MA1E]
MTTITYDTDLLPPPELKVPSLVQALAPESVKNDDPFLDLSDFPVPKGFDNVGSLELNNLSTAEDVATLQNQLNKLAEEKHKRSTWKGLTFRIAVQDMWEALTGIPTDIYQNSGRVSLKELLTRDDRLRGLGLIFFLVAVVSIFFLAAG